MPSPSVLVFNEKVIESLYELLQLNVDYVLVRAAKWLVFMTGKIKIPSHCASALMLFL